MVRLGGEKLKIDRNLAKRHCSCVLSFDNGVSANPIHGMANWRRPPLIMVKFQISPRALADVHQILLGVRSRCFSRPLSRCSSSRPPNPALLGEACALSAAVVEEEAADWVGEAADKGPMAAVSEDWGRGGGPRLRERWEKLSPGALWSDHMRKLQNR